MTSLKPHFAILLVTITSLLLPVTSQAACDARVLLVGGDAALTAELYDPATQTFTPTTSPPSTFGTATLLPSGKVLITGSGIPQLYDPQSQTFNDTGSTIDSGHSLAVRLKNGDVFLPRGTSSDAEVYSWHRNRFHNVKGTSTYSSNVATGAALVDNGQVLLIYGPSSNTEADTEAELYRPASDDYVVVGKLLGSANGGGETVTALFNGFVLIAGGYASFPFVKLSELYSPISNTFNVTTGSVNPVAYMSATRLSTGEVLFLGGMDGFVDSANPIENQAQIYEPWDQQFVSINISTVPCNTVCSIAGDCGPYDCPTERVSHQATLLPGGEVLITGGIVQIPGNCIHSLCDYETDSAWLYNPTNQTFQATSTSMTTARDGHTATLICE